MSRDGGPIGIVTGEMSTGPPARVFRPLKLRVGRAALSFFLDDVSSGRPAISFFAASIVSAGWPPGFSPCISRAAGLPKVFLRPQRRRVGLPKRFPRRNDRMAMQHGQNAKSFRVAEMPRELGPNLPPRQRGWPKLLRPLARVPELGPGSSSTLMGSALPEGPGAHRQTQDAASSRRPGENHV